MRKRKKNPTFGGWMESFQSFVSYCSITTLESSCWLQLRTEGKRASPPLCHTHTLFSTPTFHFWINHGAERGAQELLCMWDSLCALAQWYLCQIVRCVACRYTPVIPDRRQNKALAMWGEKRHRRNFLCANLSLGMPRHSSVAVLQRNTRRETVFIELP